MGRELGRRLGVPVKLVPYDSPGQMAKAVATGAWDVAFLGIEPERAAEIAFSPPYVEIEPPTWCETSRHSSALPTWTGRACASR